MTAKGLLLVLIVVTVSWLAFLPFNKSESSDPEYTYKVNGKVGHIGKQKVMYISDTRGEEFLMEYTTYKSLFKIGGYNNVIKFYYELPYADGSCPMSNRFKPDTSDDAESVNAELLSSFNQARTGDSVYHPPNIVVRRAIKVRQRKFTNYNPSTAKPSIL